MATFQDWVEDIIENIANEMPNIKSTWPYSGFFDWFNETTPPGYLPHIMSKIISNSKAGNSGLDNDCYRVNNNFIFIGQNPNHDLSNSIPIPPAYINNGNFIGFNMDSSTSTNDWVSGTGLLNFIKILGFAYPSAIEKFFRGSYMTDVSVIVSSPKGRVALEKMNETRIQQISDKILRLELEVYKKHVFPNEPESFKSLTFCTFGGNAWKELSRFRACHKLLFPGARVVRLRHYSPQRMDYARCLQNLVWLYEEAVSKSPFSIMFPAEKPSNIETW